MTYSEICQRAEARCAYLLDGQVAKVFVASRADDPTAADIVKGFREAVDRQGVEARVVATGSFGYDDLEPIVLIEKPGKPTILYHNVTAEKASILVHDYLEGDRPRPDMALCAMGKGGIKGIPDASGLALFRLQTRIALRNCGLIDPEEIDPYFVRGQGYEGLSKAQQMEPSAVIGEVRASGLRGRGGAGYCTADKWQVCRDAQGQAKYLVCNGLDSDPQARTARLLLESDPHSVLEGMLIAAYAVGASRCIICLEGGLTIAIRRVRRAIDQMRSYGVLGDSILGTAFGAEMEVREVPPSFVSGEETALLRMLEGKQAMPYGRPPYPAAHGLKGAPTVVGSGETFANVSAILQRGSAWFSAIGTEGSRGSKVFTLSGDVTHRYTVEVPFGTTLRALVEEIGGGISGGKGFKAVRIGGPTGTYAGADALDRAIDYGEAERMGAIIGSGTIEVFGSDACAVEMAADAISYLQMESCGKCVFCREGTYQMADILKGISEQTGTTQDLELLDELAAQMRRGCICSLGKGAPNAVLSSVKLFRDDYEGHIRGKICKSGSLKS